MNSKEGFIRRLKRRANEVLDGPPAKPGRREFLKTMGIVSAGAVLAACGIPIVPVIPTTPRPDGEPPTPRPDPTATKQATATQEATKKATQEPTKKAEPSETAAAAPEFEVDADGYMLSKSGNYGVMDLIPGNCEIVPGSGMDRAVTNLLLDEMSSGKYNRISALGPILVDVPTAQSGSGYVEGYKPMRIDFSRIKFSIRAPLTHEELASISASFPDAAISMTGAGDSGVGGLVTRIGTDGFTYVDIYKGKSNGEQYGDLEVLRFPVGQVLFWARMIFRRASGSAFISLNNSSQARATAIKYPIFALQCHN